MENMEERLCLDLGSCQRGMLHLLRTSVIGFAATGSPMTLSSGAARSSAALMNFHEYKATTNAGVDKSMSDYKGKPVQDCMQAGYARSLAMMAP